MSAAQQIEWGGVLASTGFSGAATNHTVDAADDGVAWVFQPYSADAITQLWFRYGARTGTPPTYSIRLESLDTSGLPDNTDVGGGSPTAVTFTPPADASIDGAGQWKTLTNAYTPTRGQTLVATIRHSSGTVDGSNNSSFTRNLGGINPGSRGFPYALTLAGGSWSKVGGSVFGWRTASGRFGVIATGSYTTVTANTLGHKSGMHFTIPSDWCSTFKVLGVRFLGKIGAAGGSAKIGLWQTDGTELQSKTIDSDHAGTSGVGTGIWNEVIFSDVSLATLSAGTKYYAGVEVISGTSNVSGVTFTDAEDRESFPFGLQRGLVTYAGSFTETNTVMPSLTLILSDITAPSGSGGGPLIGGRIVL